MAAPTAKLKQWLSRLNNNNAQGEYYLTDVVAMARPTACPWWLHSPRRSGSAGREQPAQLADLERRHQHAQANKLMEQGVRLADPLVLTCAAS